MGVPYYVDKSFEKEYHGAALDELEKTIESDYIDHLQTSCWKEKQQSKMSSHPLVLVITVNCTAVIQGCKLLSSACDSISISFQYRFIICVYVCIYLYIECRM